MFRKFLRDERGAYAMMTTIAMVPILGGLALAVDFAEMSRQRQITFNALDAAGVATARRIDQGPSRPDLTAQQAADEIVEYAEDFFEANLGPVDPVKTALTVKLPTTAGGGDTLKLTAALTYDPYFFPSFRALIGDPSGTRLAFDAEVEIRLKNTVEVALVLDNSGSMEYLGSGSGLKRIDLLKAAAKQLVDTIAAQGLVMKNVVKPVQFGVVPFSASVNVGSGHASASWMDTTGISPIHHENFNWASINTATKKTEKVGDVWYARGDGWGTQKDKPLTRFSIYDTMQRVATKTQKYKCVSFKRNGTCKDDGWEPDGYDYTYASVAAWSGCVESRPHPYNVNDTIAATATPATLFVPMFGPDETDKRDGSNRPSNNNWRKDVTSSDDNVVRQAYMPKYFDPGTEVSRAFGLNEGPNTSCGTKPITPLTDVTKADGLAAVKAAIDDMRALGATNVPEGMAWGWRVVSGGAPFTEGRPDSESGNDKVVIVLTDGANTYYTPNSVMASDYSGGDYWKGAHDLAGAKAIYSSYGYLKPYSTTYSHGRLFLGTTGVTKTDFSNANYSKAMNEHFAELCNNAKTGRLLVLTVALDLDETKPVEKAQIDALSACASFSRINEESKLFWNATGGTLADTFKEIADELSNLRIVG